MADAFAVDNVSVVNRAPPTSPTSSGCDGPAVRPRHRPVRDAAGAVLRGGVGLRRPGGRDGPRPPPAGDPRAAPTRCRSWSTRGNDQGNCDIEEGIGPGVACYLWYDNDLFNGSSFGFLNLCTATRLRARRDGTSTRGTTARTSAPACASDWINGNWTGGPNVVNYPAPTYVCRVSGLTSSNWSRAWSNGSGTI